MRKLLIVTGVLCLLILAEPCEVKGAKKMLGDESDGSRAHPVHIIPLVTEEGEAIAADDDPLLPFSTKATCGMCHSYETISKGWHFNSTDPDLSVEGHGRIGQPWILADSRTGMQIPISYRPWPGAFTPEQVGLSSRLFLKIFGRHMPGGGIGDIPSEEPDEIMRTMVSGNLESNCLSCHDGSTAHNQAEYGRQVMRENFRWAAAATSSFAKVTGSAKDMPDTYDPMMPEPLTDPKLVPPTVKYAPNTFGSDGRVTLEILREAPSHQCYFCHSNLYIDSEHVEKWSSDEDIHLSAGLECVDCHRNGIDHNITRGYEGEAEVSDNALAARSSCKGCHLPGEPGSVPTAGRLGAPVPKHSGLPPVHFEKLSCTACHSGPWPGDETALVKTSMAHKLGTRGVNKSPQALPHIIAPVFAVQSNGKIAPHKMIWPAFWADMKDANVAPIGFEAARRTVGKVMAAAEMPTSGDWPGLTAENIADALKALSGQVEGKAVYISGGSMYSLDDSGKLDETKDHPAAKPYMWPIAHDVRPAGQSLGVRGCEDCHSPEAPFFYGKVAIDSPVKSEAKAFRSMIEMHGVHGPKYVRVNFFFKLLIIVMMSLLILHILGDLFRRVVNRLSKKSS